jgi:hypothetical protein
MPARIISAHFSLISPSPTVALIPRSHGSDRCYMPGQLFDLAHVSGRVKILLGEV